MKRLNYKATLEGNNLLNAQICYPVIRYDQRLSAKAKAHAEKTLKIASGSFKNAARAQYISALRKCESFDGFYLVETYEKKDNTIVFTCYLYDGVWHKRTAVIK